MVLAAAFVGIAFTTWIATHTAIQGWGRYRERFVETAQRDLNRMYVFIDGRRVFLYNAFVIVVVPFVTYTITGRLLFAVIAGVLALWLPKFVLRYLYRRRLRIFDEQLPDGLTMIASAMRAGASLPIAIEGMVRETRGPVSQEFSMVLREQRMGVALDQAFENVASRVPSEDLTLVVAAARVAREVGGSLAEIFERLADTLRQKAIMEGKIRSLTSQGKMQGWVVGLLPIGIVVVLYQMEPEAMYPLFSSLAGWGVLLFITVMELMGAFMIKKIVSIDV